MSSTDARPVPIKNTAYRATFPLFDADGDLVTGAAGLDSEVSKDGGTFADCTNEATEIATSSGMYYLDLTSTEMNADTVAVIVKTSTNGAKTTPLVLYPVEAGDIDVDVTAWNGTAVATPDTAGYPKITIKDGTGTGELDTASGRVLADLTHIGGVAVSTTTAQLGVNVVQISTDATAADNAEAFFDGTGYAGTGNTIPTVTTATNVTTVNGLAAGVITAASIAADAITAAKVAADVGTEIAAAVWDRLTSALTTVGSIGKLLVDNVNATISSRASQTSLDTVDDFIDTEVAAIKTKTDFLPSATAGAAGGLFIAGSNAATTVNITGNLTGNVSGSVGSVTTVSDKTGYALTSGEHTNIADALLKRDWTAVSGEAARSVLNALRFLRNKWSVSGATLTVTKEDDSTSAWTASLTTDAGAEPITASDPS